MNITNKKNKIIDVIQSARSKNNKNWMDLLRLSLKLAPKEATKILKNINTQDKKISKLLNKLGK
tara:strand:- start:17351 stop:17542 length:192 start_codon:yes stop_codon:yes gene_type:complete